MKKTLFILMLALFFLLGTPSVSAWMNCTPSACGTGYTDNGIYCTGGTCYRNCTALVCDSNWASVHSTTFGFNQYDDDEHAATSSAYTPTNSSNCYNFTYYGAPADNDHIMTYVDDDPPTPPGDCDSEMIGGFLEDSTHWYSGMNNYVGDQTNSDVDFMRKTTRAHAETDSNDYPEYKDDASESGSIYCAPNVPACTNMGGTGDCDTDCYNLATAGHVVQGYYKDKGSEDSTLYTGSGCGDAYCYVNRMLSVNYTVYESSATTVQNGDESCYRTNEAPNATSVKVIPLNATAGQDLWCNYTYYDPELYLEQNSSFEWWKNGVNQEINSEMLGKGNLTVGDVWYCKVIPSDGLLNGIQVQSENNVTVLSTVKNLAMYIDGVNAWNYSGYFSGPEMVLDFTDEFNSALSNCTPDAEGYCNISLTYFSEDNGKLNLSSIGIYHASPLPNVTLIAPTNNSAGETNAPITFSFTVYSAYPIKNCSLWGNWTTSLMEDDIEDSYSCEGYFDSSYPCTNAFDENWSSQSIAPNGNISYIYENYTTQSNSYQANLITKFQCNVDWGCGGTGSNLVWCKNQSNQNWISVLSKYDAPPEGGPMNYTRNLSSDCLTGGILEIKSQINTPGGDFNSGWSRYFESKVNWTVTSFGLNQTTNSTVIRGATYNFTPVYLDEGDYLWNVQCFDERDIGVFGENNFILTISGSVSESSARAAIELGINSSALTSYSLFTDQQLYVRYLNNTQMKGKFDKVVLSGNQTWAFNYITGNESFTNITGLSNNTLVIWESQSLTSEQITQQVETLINQTKW